MMNIFLALANEKKQSMKALDGQLVLSKNKRKFVQKLVE